MAQSSAEELAILPLLMACLNDEAHAAKMKDLLNAIHQNETAKTAMQAAQASAEVTLGDAREKQIDAEKMLAAALQRGKDLDARELELSKINQSLVADKAAHDAHRADVASAHTKRVAELDFRQRDLDVREGAIGPRETDVADKEIALAQRAADLDQRHAAVKALIDGTAQVG